MESGLNMLRNDVVMTPLRVKQAIDSRFFKPSENELNVLINGTWVEFVKVTDEPGGWYDTLGFTEFTVTRDPITGYDEVNSNEIHYTPQEMLDILPFYAKWNGTATNVETGEPAGKDDIAITLELCVKDQNMVIEYKRIIISHEYEDDGRIVQSDDLPDGIKEDRFYTFNIRAYRTASAPDEEILVDGYVEIKENDANGVVLGHYPLHSTLGKGEPQCYLTSAMVGYYGKDDDGVELTAMRRLREVYAEKHAETLKTYYTDSAKIVSEIERLGMEDYYYGRIKDVVDEIVIHVENENWSVAEGLYLDLYYELKEELM